MKPVRRAVDCDEVAVVAEIESRLHDMPFKEAVLASPNDQAWNTDARGFAFLSLTQSPISIEHGCQRAASPSLGIVVESPRLERVAMRTTLHDRAQGREIERPQRHLRNPRDLKSSDIRAAQRLRGIFQHLPAPDIGVRPIHHHGMRETLRMICRHPPSDERSQIMPDDFEAFRAVAVSQGEDIADEEIKPVMLDAIWRVAQIIAPQVRDDHMVASVGERRDLVAPSPPEFRKTVEQNHERRAVLSGFDNVQVNAITSSARFPPAGFEQ